MVRPTVAPRSLVEFHALALNVFAHRCGASLALSPIRLTSSNAIVLLATDGIGPPIANRFFCTKAGLLPWKFFRLDWIGEDLSASRRALTLGLGLLRGDVTDITPGDPTLGNYGPLFFKSPRNRQARGIVYISTIVLRRSAQAV